MNINGKYVDFKEIAYDGCHKIYLIQDDEDKEEAFSYGYHFYPKENLIEIYEGSCPLRFIETWKLEKIVKQFEDKVIIEGVEVK